MSNTANITYHMATCIFYNLHEIQVPDMPMSLNGEKINTLILRMHQFIDTVKVDPIKFMTSVYKNYTEVNNYVIKWQDYVGMFLTEFAARNILKLFKYGDYENLFRRILADTMLSYIIKIREMSPTMYLMQSIDTYRSKCVRELEQKLIHHTGVAVHASIDPSIETVPLQMYESLRIEHENLTKKYNKLKNKSGTHKKHSRHE
jgi:hypothetical protein